MRIDIIKKILKNMDLSTQIRISEYVSNLVNESTQVPHEAPFLTGNMSIMKQRN
jgi:hypothetical protein